jgi:two-component system phosphate regulon response regulator PhoB
LDIMMPQMSGLQVARQMRTNPKTATIPIVMLTAKSEEVDEVAGLQVGADDYITKPFSVKVLLARIEATLRRSQVMGGAPTPSEGSGSLELGPVRADLSTHDVTMDGQSIKFTLTEFRLLVAMLRRPGKVISRADLMYNAMGPDVLVTARTIDVHVASIRKKLGRAGSMIRTVRGVGYLLRESPVDGAAVGSGDGDDDDQAFA